MAEVFVIRNQFGHYWGKGKAWVDGSQSRLVMRSRHRDEAINTLFELSSKDIELRGEVIPAELSERGEPLVEASQIPLPMNADAAPAAEADDDAASIATPATAPPLEPEAPAA